jgi:hypothetical protein
MLKGEVLLLNANFEPLRTVGMQRAIGLLTRETNPARMELDTGNVFHTAGGKVFKVPSVLVLTHFENIRDNVRKSNLARLKVFTRYGFRCGYCGAKPGQSKLTIDHVIPTSKGGDKTDPNNLAAACKPCNNRKADRTPEQAGMSLRIQPKPLNLGVTRVLSHSWAERRPEWVDYLFLGQSDKRFQQHEE